MARRDKAAERYGKKAEAKKAAEAAMMAQSQIAQQATPDQSAAAPGPGSAGAAGMAGASPGQMPMQAHAEGVENVKKKKRYGAK